MSGDRLVLGRLEVRRKIYVKVLGAVQGRYRVGNLGTGLGLGLALDIWS